jgi:enoyl-CoA hydratase/carnithine racemase
MLKWVFRGFWSYSRIRWNTAFAIIGKGRAMEMIMTAGMINADEAHRNSLANHVVLGLLDFCNGIAQKIIKTLSPLVKQLKR